MTDDPCAQNPGDCRQAIEELYEFLDGELTQGNRASIDRHLDDCSHCFDAFEFQAELKALVSQKCRSELPDGLKNRVFAALRALDN